MVLPWFGWIVASMIALAPGCQSLLEAPDREVWPPELQLLLGEGAAGILAVAAEGGDRRSARPAPGRADARAATTGSADAGGLAGASGGAFGLNDQRPAIELVDSASFDASADDASPESADSPNESVDESADSPFDSPDDRHYVDPTPESADSPNDNAQDSPAPAPAPVPAPAESPDSPASADSASWDSPDSGGSD